MNVVRPAQFRGSRSRRSGAEDGSWRVQRHLITIESMGGADEQTLMGLLDDELNFDPTTTDALTNHLPMALLAKSRLGADADELLRFKAKYQRRLQPLKKSERQLDQSNWTSAIGRRGAATDLRRYFARSIAEHGVDAVLRTHLSALLAGIGGGAFHGVIRLSYALDSASPARIAAGLAYLAELGDALGPLPDRRLGSGGVSEIANALSRSDPPLSVPKGWNIGERMREVAGDERFQDAVGSLQFTDDTESQLAEFSLRLFATSGDFTSLHGVTGMAAVSSIRPWVEDVVALDRYTVQALLAAYVTLGAPPIWSQSRLDEFVSLDQSSVADVAAVGASSDDEHVSKLIYTAHTRWAESDDPLYLAVAARHAGLSDS